MITLLVGGTRSGKSALAEQVAERSGAAVTYLATALVAPSDAAHVERVAKHRERRPNAWRTLECGARLPEALAATSDGTALVDSLGSWVAAHPDLEADVPALLAALASRSGHTIVVAEAVGMGVHAATAVGRRFEDELGRATQAVAAVADDAWFVVAGRVLRLEVLV